MFKYFNQSDKNVYEFKTHRKFELNQSQLDRYKFISASNNSLSSSYYNFARINFYLSGSELAQNNPTFNDIAVIGSRDKYGEPIFLNKFYSEGSIVSISQLDFKEEIKRGSFLLTDNSTSSTIEIKDDSNGNLYAPDATFSQSADTSISSSDNYVGNIFYDVGIFTITETASFDGSVNYSDATSTSYLAEFKGTQTNTTYEWVCGTKPGELNNTTNMTVYNSNGLGQLKDNLTSSLFPIYITEIGLYDEQNLLLGYAKLSKPIPKSTKMPMKFFVRMDY